VGTYREYLALLERFPNLKVNDSKQIIIICDRQPDHMGDFEVICAFGYFFVDDGGVHVEIAPYSPFPPYEDSFEEEVLLDNHLIQRESMTLKRHQRFSRQNRIRFRYTLSCKCGLSVPIRTEKLDEKIAQEIFAGRSVVSLGSLIIPA